MFILFAELLKFNNKNPDDWRYCVSVIQPDGYTVLFCKVNSLAKLYSGLDGNFVIKNDKAYSLSAEYTSSINNIGKSLIEDTGTVSHILSMLLGCDLLLDNGTYRKLEGINVSSSGTKITLTVMDGDLFKVITLYDFDPEGSRNYIYFKKSTLPEQVLNYGTDCLDGNWKINLNDFPITTIPNKSILPLSYEGSSFCDLVVWAEMPNIVIKGINFMLRMADLHFNNKKIITSNQYYPKLSYYERKMDVKIKHNSPYKAFYVDNIEEYQKNPGFDTNYLYDELFLLGMQSITISNDIGYDMTEVRKVKELLRREYDKRQLYVFKGKYIITDVITPKLNKESGIRGKEVYKMNNNICNITITVNGE